MAYGVACTCATDITVTPAGRLPTYGRSPAYPIDTVDCHATEDASDFRFPFSHYRLECDRYWHMIVGGAVGTVKTMML